MADKTIEVLYIPVGGDPELRTIGRSDVRGLQGMVGGYLEVIAVRGAHVYVNEDGITLNLPVNTLGTALLRYLGSLAPYVRGPVVCVGLPDRNGNDTSVPDAVKAKLTEGGA